MTSSCNNIASGTKITRKYGQCTSVYTGSMAMEVIEDLIALKPDRQGKRDKKRVREY